MATKYKLTDIAKCMRISLSTSGRTTGPAFIARTLIAGDDAGHPHPAGMLQSFFTREG
jgi:hypothetical protein